MEGIWRAPGLQSRVTRLRLARRATRDNLDPQGRANNAIWKRSKSRV